MRIAILLSTYNGADYLDTQIESIANQTYIKYIRIYVRDDNSRDNTHAILKKWESKIKISVYNGNNVGPASSFWELFINKDIIADYYFFCDQDDIWDVDKVENGVLFLESEKQYCLYCCNCRTVDGQGKLIKDKMLDSIPVISIPRLFVSGIYQGCSMIATKELREYIIQCNLKCIPMHDIIVMLYAFCYGKIKLSEEPEFSYRLHDNNVVAKSGKNIAQKLMTTTWNWKNSSKNSMSQVAEEILTNFANLSKEDKKYLFMVCNYKKSLKTRIKLCLVKSVRNSPQASFRSYCIRILLKLY